MLQKSLLIACLLLMRVSYAQPETQDTTANRLALQVINAMGGTEAFDNISYLGWNFFGSRQIIWDKVHHRVRIDYLKKKVTIITDLDSDSGKLFMNDVEVTHPDSLAKYLYKGKVIWMNDSYWLIMPFKLFDTGVMLKYLGVKNSIGSVDAHVIEMTFNAVGATPENKYWIYIDPNTHFIIQWDFYNAYTDPVPEFTNTWGDYQKFGNVSLSGDRGSEGVLSDIHTWDQLPESVFNDLKIPPMHELSK